MLPKHQHSKVLRNNVVTAKEHLNAFSTALEDNAASEHEDVAIKLFVKSLEGEPASWFKRIPEKSMKSWNDLMTPFLKTWDTKVDLGSLLIAFQQIQKVKHESVIEFNVGFQKVLGRIPDDAKPMDIVTLTFTSTQSTHSLACP